MPTIEINNQDISGQTSSNGSKVVAPRNYLKDARISEDGSTIYITPVINGIAKQPLVYSAAYPSEYIKSIIKNDNTIKWTKQDGTFDTFTVDLSSKQDVLVNQQNIKSINGVSVLGSGNITVSGEPSEYIKSITKATNSFTWTKKDGSTDTFRVDLSSKQDVINDLSTIRDGASKGASAVQPEAGKGLFSGKYSDLTGAPTKLSQFTNDGDGTNKFITKNVADLTNYYLKQDVYTKTDVTDLLEKKLDKSTTTVSIEHAYTHTASGDSIMQINGSAAANTIARRTPTGALRVKDAVNNDEAVTLSQLTSGLADKQNITDNTLTTTKKKIPEAINELDSEITALTSLVAVKVDSTLPTTPDKNTLYFIGTTTPYHKYLITTDGTTHDLGTGEVDLSQYRKASDQDTIDATKQDNLTAVKGLEITSKNEIGHTNTISAQTTFRLCSLKFDAYGHITETTTKTLGRGIDDKTNVIGHSNSITAETTGKLGKIKYDEYGHISGLTEVGTDKGITIDSSNNIGHTNSVTKQDTEVLQSFKFDEYGHITGATTKTLGRGLEDKGNEIGHTNSVTEQTDAKLDKIKFDAQGHITEVTEITVDKSTGSLQDSDDNLASSKLVKQELDKKQDIQVKVTSGTELDYQKLTSLTISANTTLTLKACSITDSVPEYHAMITLNSGITLTLTGVAHVKVNDDTNITITEATNSTIKNKGTTAQVLELSIQNGYCYLFDWSV